MVFTRIVSAGSFHETATFDWPGQMEDIIRLHAGYHAVRARGIEQIGTDEVRANRCAFFHDVGARNFDALRLEIIGQVFSNETVASL